MTNSALETATILAAIAKLRASVAVARGLVLSGRAVDLAGLDGEATRLCAAAACVDKASHPALLQALTGAEQDVARLQLAMRRA